MSLLLGMSLYLQFHQTIQTYLNDRIWQFYFYVSKNWPEEPVCLHFPGCTLKVRVCVCDQFLDNNFLFPSRSLSLVNKAVQELRLQQFWRVLSERTHRVR